MIDEQARLEELERYDVLDSEPEPAFDRLAELVALACNAPIALISLIDDKRQWFKATHGIALRETPREVALCDHTIRAGRLVVIEDATADPRLKDSPLVGGAAGLRFYAGAPLTTPRGLAVGTVCALDRRARPLSASEQRGLLLLRDEVLEALETRREQLELRRAEALRAEAVEALLATKANLEKRIALRTREAETARRRMEQVLARVTDGFVALNREWRYTYVTERAAELLQRRAGELIGQLAWSEFSDGASQPFRAAGERALREQTPQTVRRRSVVGERWFEDRIYPSPEGVTVFFTEITEQRRTEEALRQSEHRLAEAQAVAHVGSWEWSVADNRVRWSAELFHIYGLTQDQFAGSYEGFLAHVHVDDVERTKAVIADALAHAKPFVYDHRIVRADGAVRMLHTRGDVVTDGEGRVLRMVGSCWDTTER